METKVVGGRDSWWKVLEGAWVVGMRGSEFRCCMECNTRKVKDLQAFLDFANFYRWFITTPISPFH